MPGPGFTARPKRGLDHQGLRCVSQGFELCIYAKSVHNSCNFRAFGKFIIYFKWLGNSLGKSWPYRLGAWGCREVK